MKIVVSCGDVNGIGLEIFLKAVKRFSLEFKYSNDVDFTLVVNKHTLLQYANNIRTKITVRNDYFSIRGRKINLIDCKNQPEVQFGRITKSSGELAAESIKIALDKTIKKEFDAMLTLPISKESIYKTGWKFPGHTEMVANACKVDNPLMILCTKAIRVALATIHVPLKKVPALISSDLLVEKAVKMNKSLMKDFCEQDPRIAVLGLNPHSGENGNLGKEELEIIKPAIKRLKEKNVNAFGPFSADGFFAHGEYLRYDGIIAMYHDQGLIPLKLIAMGSGINYTAGLPIIRVSPDHGTAFDIAGRNLADEASTYNSIELAYSIFQNRNNAK